MKVIIAGGRDFDNWYMAKEKIAFYLKNIHEPIEIVSGRCDDAKKGVHTFTTPEGVKVYGADGLGERYAKEHRIPVTPFPAKWDKYGAAAGPKRNNEMAIYAKGQYLIAFHDGKSFGTANMIKLAKANNITVRVVNYSK